MTSCSGGWWCSTWLGSNYSRRARNIPQEVHFSLEQPSSPKSYEPEVVSFWDTKEWDELKREFKWSEVHCDQGRMGGLSTKRTTFGGSLELNVEDFMLGASRNERVKNSKELSRWAPGLMSSLAQSLMKNVFTKVVSKQKVLTWAEHVALILAMFLIDAIAESVRKHCNYVLHIGK